MISKTQNKISWVLPTCQIHLPEPRIVMIVTIVDWMRRAVMFIKCMHEYVQWKQRFSICPGQKNTFGQCCRQDFFMCGHMCGLHTLEMVRTMLLLQLH